jgi:Holliday junction DNA helicase RuvB
VKRKLKLIAGLPRKKLLEEIHYHLRNGDVARRALGFYLRDMEVRREHKALGYASAVQFGELALELPRKNVRELLLVARRLEQLPAIDRAFAAGEITEETEKEWLEFAKKHTVKKVERAASNAKRGERPQGNELGTPRVKFRIQLDVPAHVNELWQVALAKLMEEIGEEATPVAALQMMTEMAIRKDPEGNVAGRKDRDQPVYTVVYHVGGNASKDGSQGVSQGGIAAWLEGEEERVAIAREVVREAARAGRVIEVKDIEDPGETDAIRFGERGKVPPEDRDPPVSDSQRTAVLAREGHRCAVCKGRCKARPHHLKSRANGGKSLIEYLVSLCHSCHAMLHQHLLILRVAEGGGLIALDKDGSDLRKEGGPARVLECASKGCPLTVIEMERAPGNGNLPAATPGAGKVESPHDPCRPADAAEGEQPGAPRGAAEATQVEAPQEPCRAALAAEGEQPGAPRGAAEATQVEAPQESRAALPAPFPSIYSIEGLPSVLSAAQWLVLQSVMEWSSKRRSYLFCPEADGFLEMLPAPRGARERGEMAPGNDLGQGAAHKSSPLRPRRFADLVGQRRVVENLELAASAARMRGEPLEHLLLSGPGGLGKTTLAHVIATEMKATLHTAMGPMIEEPQHLISLLTGLGAGDMLFIDEIHRLEKCSQECLYSALEDCAVDVVVAQGTRMRTIRILLEPFTLIGATTQLGDLSEPFRSRFQLQERLEFYSQEELAQVIERAAAILRPGGLGLTITHPAAEVIASRARGIPREGLRLLKRARDVAQAATSREIDLEHVARVGAMLGIDEQGLWSEDRKILQLLTSQGRPMGIKSIAATLGMEPTTLEQVYEPHLLARGYVVRTARGREASPQARRLCGTPGDGVGFGTLRLPGSARSPATIREARFGQRVQGRMK